MAGLQEHFERVEIEPGFGSKRNNVYVNPRSSNAHDRPSSASNAKPPVFYEEYTFTKEPSSHTGLPEKWERSRKTVVPGSQSELDEQAKKLTKRFGSATRVLVSKEMAGNKRKQVERLLESRMRSDDPKYEYILASLSRDVRGTRGNPTSVLHVIIKRQLKSNVAFNSSVDTRPPRPSVVSELVDLGVPLAHQQGGFRVPQHGPPGPAPFGHQPQSNQPRNNTAPQSAKIIDDRFPHQQQQQQHGQDQGGQKAMGVQQPKGGPQPSGEFHGAKGFAEDFVNNHASGGIVNKGRDKDKDKKGMSPKKNTKKQDVSESDDSSDDVLSFDDDFFEVENRSKKSKPMGTKIPMDFSFDCPKPHKKQHHYSDSSSQSDSSEKWSKLSEDSFPTTISSGGHSKKDKDNVKNLFKDSKTKRRDSHDEVHSPVYRVHKRPTPQPGRRDSSPASSRRPPSASYSDDNVVIEPARNGHRNHGGPRGAHFRNESYDDGLYRNDDLRGLGLNRGPSVYRRKIMGKPYARSDKYDYDYEREDEEIEVHERVEREVARREREDRMRKRVQSELAKKEEERMIIERVREEVARARSSRRYGDCY